MVGKATKALRRPAGATPLHLAAAVDSQGELTQWLSSVSLLAALELRDNVGRTPLFVAAQVCPPCTAADLPRWSQAGHAAAIRALISAGADPEAEDKAGCTPMLAASSEGQAQSVAALVLGGAVRGMPDLEGLTDGVAAIDRSE